MLKLTCAAAAAACLLATPAQAEYVYNGFLRITSKNAACTKGPKPGTVFRAHYHPKTVSGDVQELQQSILNITNAFDVRSLKSSTQNFGSTSVAITNTVLTGLALQTVQPGRLSLTSQTPAVLASTSTDVSFTGKITNFRGLKGQENCVVGYSFSGILRYP